MQIAPNRVDESETLRALAGLQVLDTDPEPDFDALVQAASLVCGVPIALVSLIDADRQWFKANIGLPGVTSTPREQAFCAHAVLETDLMEVPDASLDARFAGNPLVVGEPRIRFYAGAPLRLNDGHQVGTLCVIDRQPRSLTEAQRSVLRHLATAVSSALEGRRARLVERQAMMDCARAALVLQHSADAIVGTDEAGIIVRWNPAAERLFGHPRSDALGQALTVIVPEGERANESDRLASVRADGAQTYDALRLHRDGTPIAVAVTLVPELNGSGELVGCTAFMRDQRERERSRAVLAASESRFRALSDGSPLGVFQTDAQGACTYTNAPWQSIYGMSREQSLGPGWADALHALDREAVFAEWQRCAMAGIEFDMEFRVRRADASVRRVHSRARPILDVNGALTGHVGTVEDITERHEMVARLAANEDRLRRLYERTPAMLHAVDENGRLTMVSDAWLARLGYTRAEVLGRPSVEFLTEASRQFVLGTGIPTLTQSGRRDNLELQMLTRDGEVVDVLLSAVVQRGENGEATRTFAGLQDVTLRRRAERELEFEHQRLLNILEATHAGIWEWHVPSGEVRLNERSAAIVGSTLAELGPQTIAHRTKTTHPDDMPLAAAEMRRHLAGETDHYEVESRLRHRDGHWIWILDSGRLMTRTADGKPEWVFGTHQDIGPRKAQEEALRRSEAFLDRTGRAAGVGGWELDVASGGITWSDETRRIHGVAPDYQPTLASAIDFYAPESRPVIQAAVGAAMEKGTAYDLELQLVRADGRRIWVRAVGTAERAGGRTVRLSGAFQDITARKLLDRRLVEQERFIRHVLDSVPGLIAHIGPDRRYTLVNRAFLEWAKRPADEIIGVRASALHDEAEVAMLAPKLDQAFAGETVTFETELRRGNELRAMQVTYIPNQDDAGRVVGVFSMKVDVTALRRAEERLRLVMEASPQGMCTVDLDGQCTFTNAAWQRITGLSLEQSLGNGLLGVVRADEVPKLMARRRTVLEHGGVESFEHCVLRPDGRQIWVRSQLTVLRRNAGPDCFIGTLEDVTERRRLDEALAAKSLALTRSNEDLERFAYVASHDLQEPLRMVTSYGQLLERRHAAALPEQAREYLHFMVEGGQRAQALIRDLLSLARLDSHARPRTAVPLESVLAGTLRQLHLKVQETGAVITHDPLPTVTADATQMSQLFLNLVGNALKFHGPGTPEVHVGAEREANAWRISVRDNGIGIEPKFFERVFVMFQRLHLRSEHEGTGIGLAICKKIVEGHGGRIGVTSAPGQGSTFFFTLPDTPAVASVVAP